MADTKTLTGKIEYVSMGTGAWALVSDGVTYEIYNGEPSAIQQEGATVQVVGKIRDDVMSLAAIGPILEVVSFEIVE
ncbi:MAG: hypothetical protein ACFB9N_11480 [Geitlerinemataceae cyanobacterium]